MPKPEGKEQLNALIAEETHKALKMQAVLEGRTMSSILEDAIKSYLSKKKKTAPLVA
jgi:hypothetical protein